MNVGTGSSEHDFVGETMMILRTSSSDTSWNPVSDELALPGIPAGAGPNIGDLLLKEIQEILRRVL